MLTTAQFSFRSEVRRFFKPIGTLGFMLLVPTLSFLVQRWSEFGSWDGPSYAFAGWLFLKGYPFYQIAWMDKPPLALFLYAPAYLFGGLHGLQLYFVLVVCVEAMLAHAWLYRLRFGALARFAGTAALVLATFRLPELDLLSLSHLTNLFFLSALISVTFGTGRSFFVAGLFVGLSFFIRQNNVIFCIVPLFFANEVNWAAIRKYILGGMSAFIVGCLVSLLASDPYIFLYTTFAYPFAYSHLDITGGLSTADIVRTYWRTLRFGFAPLASCGLAIIILFRRKLPVTIQAVCVLGAASVAIVIAPNKPYLHYLGYSLILCVLLAACVGQVAELFISRWNDSYKTAVIFLIVVMTVVGSVRAQIGRPTGTDRLYEGSAKQLYGQSLQILLSGVQNKHGPVTALIAGWLPFTPALLMRETGVLPAQPLYFLPYLSSRFESALPPPFRKPWAIMNSNPPDIVIMFPDSLHANRDFFGADLVENVRTLVADPSYQVLLDTPQIFAASHIVMQKQ